MTKTDRQRFYLELPRGTPTFLITLANNGASSTFVEGMQAFATLWFNEFSDDQNLPREWWALVELAEEQLTVDVDELLDDDDEEEEETTDLHRKQDGSDA